MKRLMFPFIVFILLLSGCEMKTSITGKTYLFSIKENSDKIFADCDSFLMYYDACNRFLDSVPGSVCEQRYGTDVLSRDDIPESDDECYPVVECNWYLNIRGIKDRLRECRPDMGSDPKCALSFDVSCESFSAEQGSVTMVLKNNKDRHIKNLALTLVRSGENIDCTDSQGDSFLASGETDEFTCESSSITQGTFESALQLVYQDFKNEALSSATGSLVVDVGDSAGCETCGRQV
ncbi:hypothetical protein KY349_05825 [Candidatus Woesearchaeota archaeon]|nr:hypothetical protein [Candidatus Woesearchaeota archaeon]